MISKNLIPFVIPKTPNEAWAGKYYHLGKALWEAWSRLFRPWTKIDQLQIACMCEPPLYFLLYGVVIPHPYGITLSVSEIGADCLISQNVTMGTDARYVEGEHKPVIGHRVIIMSGAVISGHVGIGDNVIIGANAYVDKDVPDGSFVYGSNIIFPLREHHWARLRDHVVFDCLKKYCLVEGLVYKEGRLYIDKDYERRNYKCQTNSLCL